MGTPKGRLTWQRGARKGRWAWVSGSLPPNRAGCGVGVAPRTERLGGRRVERSIPCAPPARGLRRHHTRVATPTPLDAGEVSRPRCRATRQASEANGAGIPHPPRWSCRVRLTGRGRTSLAACTASSRREKQCRGRKDYGSGQEQAQEKREEKKHKIAEEQGSRDTTHYTQCKCGCTGCQPIPRIHVTLPDRQVHDRPAPVIRCRPHRHATRWRRHSKAPAVPPLPAAPGHHPISNRARAPTSPQPRPCTPNRTESWTPDKNPPRAT